MQRTHAWIALLVTCAVAGMALAFGSKGGSAQAPASTPIPPGGVVLTVPQAALTTDGALVVQLRQQTGNQVRVAYHNATGKVRFIGTDLTHPIRVETELSADASPEQAARAFLNTYGSLFGLSNPARELVVSRVQLADRGRTVVRFQQYCHDVPILGGEVVVQLDGQRNVISANGEIVPAPRLDVSASVSAEQARQTALEVIAQEYHVDADALLTDSPVLWIYSAGLLGTPGLPITTLVWRTEVRSEQGQPIRELVLVDAHLDAVTLHFDQIATARNRRIYDNQNDPGAGLPGRGPVRAEGQGATGLADADDAYEYTGDTYDFYRNYFGRDSLDNRGLTLISTVRYCAPIDEQQDCPYPNAFWNGEQMVFGDGYASADDVVAHELSHGVTSYECNLFYYMQSGAINESLSDIFGEFVDLINGKGSDSPSVRWLMGEDLSDGAGRNMANPPAFQHPDRMGSSYYYFTTNPNQSDNGGVHENSGVNNKAAYLLTDGDDFNGYHVQGLGIAKVAQIYYELSTHLLTSASDYADLYDLLPQACINLVGSFGITSSDVDQVRNAVAATEMDQQPGVCPANEALVCSDMQAPIDLFYDDFEDLSSRRWITGTSIGECAWYYPPPTWLTYATSGRYSLLGWDVSQRSQSYIKMTSDVLIPSGVNTYMCFNHAFQFDAYPEQNSYFDGGIVAYSTDGGQNWLDAGELFVENGYNGTLFAQGDNPLAGWSAFGSESCGYISSRLDLTSLAGQRVRFAFIVATDKENLFFYYGWFIDDVRVYTCGANVTPTRILTRTPTPRLTPTRTPTPKPFTPKAWLRLPVVLKDSLHVPQPMPTDMRQATPTRTPPGQPTPTATHTRAPGPTPTGVPDTGGPDAFGYTWTRQAGYNWIDATNGAVIPAGSKGPFSIGFSFKFYGTTYTQFYLNTAMLQFGRSDSWSLQHVCIPSAAPPNSCAAAFWGCVGFYETSSRTYVKTVGTAPDRILVVQVNGLQHCSDGAPMTFEILLFEGSNDIAFQYQSMSANSRGDGRDVTIGIEDQTGRRGLQVSCNQAWVSDGAVVRFLYP